jgi:hypothetical protein
MNIVFRSREKSDASNRYSEYEFINSPKYISWMPEHFTKLEWQKYRYKVNNVCDFSFQEKSYLPLIEPINSPHGNRYSYSPHP